MSKRQEALQEIVDVLREKGLDEVCRARTLDGQVNVFGSKFIQVSWKTANRSLPAEGSEVFRSLEEAKTFIKETF